MAWTANLVSKEASRDGSVHLVVDYTLGQRTVQKEYTFFSDFDLNTVIKGEIDRLTALATTYISLSPGTITPSSVATSVPSSKEQFFVALSKLQNLKNLVDLGVINNTEPSYVAVQSSVRSGFDPSYY